MATIIDDENVNLAWIGTSWSTLHDDDPMLGRYFNRGDYCIITWQGTDISIYGARRKNHGLYGVSLNNGDMQYFSGYGLDGEYQATLYATSGLEQGEHQVRISNENARNIQQYPDYIWLDIDSIAITGTLTSAATIASGSTPSSQSSPSFSSAPASSDSADSPSASSTSGESPASPTSSSLSSTIAVSLTSDVSAITTSTTAGTTKTETDGIQTGQYSNSVSITIVSTSQLPNTDTLGTLSSFSPEASTTSSGNQASATESGDNADKDNHKTTTLAVSISVIAVSAIVVLSIIVWYLWRRRKRRQEEEYEDDARGYLTPQSSRR